MKIGEFMYNGGGELLESNVRYTVFETENNEIEAYPAGLPEPVTMNKGVFTTLMRGNLRQVEGFTPMR